MLRLTLDTCIVVSSFRSRLGASRALIDAFDLKSFELLISTSLLLEYEDVLTRPEQMRVHGFSLAEISKILDTLAAHSIWITPSFQWHPQLRDPGDEHVLAAAIGGGAYALVTHNVRDFLPAALSFGIQVMTPGRIMKERFRR